MKFDSINFNALTHKFAELPVPLLVGYLYSAAARLLSTFLANLILPKAIIGRSRKCFRGLLLTEQLTYLQKNWEKPSFLPPPLCCCRKCFAKGEITPKP